MIPSLPEPIITLSILRSYFFASFFLNLYPEESGYRLQASKYFWTLSIDLGEHPKEFSLEANLIGFKSPYFLLNSSLDLPAMYGFNYIICLGTSLNFYPFFVLFVFIL